MLEHTKIRRKGFEEMKRCGRSNRSLALCFRLSPNVFLPLAFSIMPLSILEVAVQSQCMFQVYMQMLVMVDYILPYISIEFKNQERYP